MDVYQVGMGRGMNCCILFAPLPACPSSMYIFSMHARSPTKERDKKSQGYHNIHQHHLAISSVRRIRPRHRRQLRLPLIPITQQLLLVIQQLLSRLGRILGIRALHNGVHGAGFLAEAAVDALGHIDVVAGGAARAVLALLGLDGDGLGGADGLAQLAGDAALLARGVAAQGVLAAEAGGDGPFFEGVVDCVSISCVRRCAVGW
jgi:hypothetical protein